MFKRASILAMLVSLTAAVPISAHAPIDMEEESTAIVCEGIVGATGTVRVTVAVSSLSGPAGFLLYWAAPADPATHPPTLMSQAVDATTDGTSFFATIAMYMPGDLGLDDSEPVFVGWADLAAEVSPSGPVDDVDQVARNGNHQFRIEGATQALTAAGSVTVPGAGDFDLAGCSGERETLEFFGTQPDADVSTIDRTRVECFWETPEILAGFTAQSDEAGTFIDLIVFDAAGVHFGTTVPALTEAGIGAVLDLDTGGSATVSASFTSFERMKAKHRTENGWVMVSLDLLSVAGSLSVQTSEGTTVLPMDDVACLADTRHVLSQSTSPGG